MTVQFTGPGEDCELKITVTGSAQRDTDRLEDPDHGNVTVQFTGPGEDCELKITVTGSAQRDD